MTGCPGNHHLEHLLWFTDAVTDKDALSPYFGDYPHGAYWSAEVPQGAQDEESYEVGGTTIKFMPDDTVTVPLWDDDGLLPEDPLWLNTVLGLSPELVADIIAWSHRLERRLERLGCRRSALHQQTTPRAAATP
jgi:hypothetical protein